MKVVFGLVAASLAAMLATSAVAKDAYCYTSDDGEYDCWFESLDGNGSFEISAPGKPTFQVWIDSPGVATVGVTFSDGSSTPLPGPHYRSADDGACWVSSATSTEICAW